MQGKQPWSRDISKHKLSPFTARHRGNQQIFYVKSSSNSDKKRDIVRLGIALVLIVCGLYLNFTATQAPSSSTTLPSYRIFQTAPDDNFIEVGGGVTTMRLKSVHDSLFLRSRKDTLSYDIEYIRFNNEERRKALISLGTRCFSTRVENKNGKDYHVNPLVSNLVLEKYDSIGEWIHKLNDDAALQKRLLAMQIELWKFCVIGSGYATMFLDYQGLHFLHSIDNIFDFSTGRNYVVAQEHNDITHGNLRSEENFVTTSVLSLGNNEAGREIAKTIVESLIDATNDQLSAPVAWLNRMLYRNIRREADLHPEQFEILRSSCIGLNTVENNLHESNHGDKKNDLYMGSCALDGQSPCCQISRHENGEETVVILMEQPINGVSGGQNLNPNRIMEGVSYISKVETVPSKHKEHTSRQKNDKNAKTQRTFDIFLENDCLPSWQCHTCLVRKRPDDKRLPCEACLTECKCYCQNICRVRPQDNFVSKEFTVTPPRIRKESNRLIPKIIHQTFFEPITASKYPNFSRLVSSWKHTGWDYNFYDDKASEDFIDLHFAPEVREAYDSIVPGAYKADLFRLCVLLIYGGIYSDVDVELTSDLDSIFEGDVGFVIPVDEPGREDGNGSCLWNGMIAASPGHPFIAKAIEIIVNQIRNRFTGVDIDNMLCPRVALDHSHAWDLLFVTGPCAIGAAINAVLGRHMQSNLHPGILKTESAVVNIPGRSILLSQNKEDMGWHRFTWLEKNLIVAGTDMPNYDDRGNQQHYSEKKPAMKMALFGTKNIYTDFTSKYEDIKMLG